MKTCTFWGVVFVGMYTRLPSLRVLEGEARQRHRKSLERRDGVPEVEHERRLGEVLVRLDLAELHDRVVLVDLRDKDVDGARVERVLELVDINCNKNTVPGDKSALQPHGLRVGAPAMTTRGLVEKDFEQVVEFLDRGIKIAQSIKKANPAHKLKDFKQTVVESPPPELAALKKEVQEWAAGFPMPGQFW